MLKRLVYCSSLFLFMVSLVVSFTYAQDKFEGKINIKVTDNDKTNDLNYFIKDGKIRIEADKEKQSAILYDSKLQKMTIVMLQKKMYVDVPAASSLSSNKQNTSSTGGNKESSQGSFKKTSETKNILGYTAEKWTFDGEDGTSTETWITNDLGSFIFLGGNPMMHQDKPSWQSKLENQGYFPLLVIHKDKSGNEESRYEVTSIEKQTLSADLFAPPSDFKKMDIPNLSSH